MPANKTGSTPDSQPFRESGKLTAFDKLAREVVRREVLDDYELLAHNTRLYPLENDWKSIIIKEDFAPHTVHTLTELETALADKGIEIILISASALISREGLERVCARTASSKIIFTERDL